MELDLDILDCENSTEQSHEVLDFRVVFGIANCVQVSAY